MVEQLPPYAFRLKIWVSEWAGLPLDYYFDGNVQTSVESFYTYIVVWALDLRKTHPAGLNGTLQSFE